MNTTSPEPQQGTMYVLYHDNKRTLKRIYCEKTNTFHSKRSSITIVAVHDKQNDTLNFGISKCHPVDKFVKVRGRDIALSRAKKKPIYIMSLKNIIAPGRLFRTTARAIAENYSDCFMIMRLAKEEKSLEVHVDMSNSLLHFNSEISPEDIDEEIQPQ